MATTKPMTAEELFELEDDGYQYELVHGELIRMPPPGPRHGEVAGEVYWQLRNYLIQNPIGRVYMEVGFLLSRDPDLVRAPDVSFVRADRLPPETERDRYYPFAPDLAVEVVSPSDRTSATLDKVMDYLDAGTPLVWVIHPGRRIVTVYYPDRTARVLGQGDELDGGDVLPGFRLPVAEIFR